MLLSVPGRPERTPRANGGDWGNGLSQALCRQGVVQLPIDLARVPFRAIVVETTALRVAEMIGARSVDLWLARRWRSARAMLR